MVTRQTQLTPDGTEWDVWEALHAEAERLYQGEWYAIARGVLYHGADWRSVADQLNARAVDRSKVLITLVLPSPPHRF